jgi:hypothetical protein
MMQLLRQRSGSLIIAGITLAALAIPEVMGYTKISGTPVITGLYTMLIPTFLFAFFGYESLNERMRTGCIGNAFEFIDIQDAKIRLPLVILE